jgi:hypothetical protein
MEVFRLIAFSVSCLLGLAGCTKPPSDSDSSASLTREQALAVAESYAKHAGHDLSKYQLDTFGRQLSEDEREWHFVFLCSPGPPPPDCGFSVLIDRETGSAKLWPGQ